MPPTPPYRPDLAQARRFLDLIDPEAEGFHFQTFDDQGGGRKTLARTLRGTLDEHAQTLEQLNAQGAGIFVTINEVRGARRTNANVQRIRACFAD
ncbi:MAG: hypothetical protein ACLFTD_13625, partial [Halochromatium sp.]